MYVETDKVGRFREIEKESANATTENEPQRMTNKDLIRRFDWTVGAAKLDTHEDGALAP